MQDGEIGESKREVYRVASRTNLQFHRKMKALTQRELAELAKVNLRTLQGYEQGQKRINKASWNTVSRLADALGVNPEDILEE